MSKLESYWCLALATCAPIVFWSFYVLTFPQKYAPAVVEIADKMANQFLVLLLIAIGFCLGRGVR